MPNARTTRRPRFERYRTAMRGLLGLLSLVAAAVSPCCDTARAQSRWEVTPYKVGIWIAAAPVPSLPARLQRRLEKHLMWRAEAEFGAVWDVESEPPQHDAEGVGPAPGALSGAIAAQIERITIEDVRSVAEKALSMDKLFLVGVSVVPDGYRVQVRELDCRTQTLGPTATREVCQEAALPYAAFHAVLEAFSPIVQVEKAEGSAVTVRLRAGALIRGGRSPALVPKDAILAPVIRRNDRLGNPRPGGVERVPWTFLSVTRAEGWRLDCRIHSGIRSALGGRRSIRIERLALVVKPAGSSTMLTLQTRREPHEPLSGYEVFSKVPGAERSELVGRTDWRGNLTIRSSGVPLRILYVKNGRTLLARLPLVPGLTPRAVAEVADDHVRLKAEGFIAGFQENLIDTVARGKILRSQIGRRIKDEKWEEAGELLEKFRELRTRADYVNQLLTQRQRFPSDVPAVQSKIDKQFGDTRKILQKYLAPERAENLASQLAEARGGAVEKP